MPGKFDIFTPKLPGGEDSTTGLMTMMHTIIETMKTTMQQQQDQTVYALQLQIEALQRRLDERPRGRERSEIPEISTKDVDKPVKYDGTDFKVWYGNFHSFLEAKDERFGHILEGIKAMSKSPLDTAGYKLIERGARITSEEVSKAFKSQLFRYLQSYTKGVPHTMILAGGADGSWEAFR